MFKNFLFSLTLAITAVVCSLPALAVQEPSMHEVYQATQEGRYIEAQTMMDQVLKEHPNSAKVHFVEAELLAKQGLLGKADAELRTAERLQPGLAFAKPQAVNSLKAIISAPRGSTQSIQRTHVNQPAPETSLPWGLMLGGLGLIAFIVFATRFMRQRSAAAMPASSYPGYGVNPAMQQPYGASGAGPIMAPAAGGGMGSGIMGSLATGAAVGAGIVAGQALMHHFTDGDRANSAAPLPTGDKWDTAPNDMGGNDFGIADSSSWDSGSGADGGSWD